MSLKEIIKDALKSVVYDACNERFEIIEKQNSELIFAQVWRDTIRTLEWAEHLPSLSPGRWAVGYNYLYLMTRVLEEIHPHKVLDLGLGISTSLFSSYFQSMNYCDGVHTVIENNSEWKSFYLSRHIVSESTSIFLKQLVEKEYNGKKYFAYDDLSDVLKNGTRYSVISVDGPWGSEVVSRRDIVDFLPNCLEDEFVIVIDDTDREGERHTVREIVQKLSSDGIETCIGKYKGTTDCTIITSSGYGFLCSM